MLPRYPIEPVRVVPVREGECMVFRVDALDGRYALRIHDPIYQSEPAIVSELVWLRALRHEAGLGVPDPVRASDGSWVVVASDPLVPRVRCCDLLRWQGGRLCATRIPPVVFARLGAFIARMHTYADGFTPPDGFVRQRWDGDHVFGRPIEEGLDAIRPLLPRPAFDAVLRVVDADHAARAELASDFGMIHADLHHGNVLSRAGEVRAIDFGDCGFGHYLYDLAVPLNAVRRMPNADALRAALLRGYRSMRTLPAEHERHLPALMAAPRLSLNMWHVLRWDGTELDAYASELVQPAGSDATPKWSW